MHRPRCTASVHSQFTSRSSVSTEFVRYWPRADVRGRPMLDRLQPVADVPQAIAIRNRNSGRIEAVALVQA